MSSLARAIARYWQNSAALCALVPFDRVFTGRVPQTQQYKFPYVSILATQGSNGGRSDKTILGFQMVGIDVWVDDAALSIGETIAEAITDAYANQCFDIDEHYKVLDVVDGGPCVPVQVDLPTVKAWEICKTFDFRVERQRADTGICCPGGPDLGSTSASSGMEFPEPGSLSTSDSLDGAWPETSSTNS